MTLTAALVGGVVGLSAKLYSNAVRKLPLSRKPWEHVLLFGLGAVAGNWVGEFNERQMKRYSEMLEDYQSRTGVNYWELREKRAAERKADEMAAAAQSRSW